ncbi:hypothetical protein [Haloarcula laminariae]|uniref:hypothetical protein n=1 Tax=Haloarcula laminariae TaxID=2961577 RepID=UPI0021C848C6
MTEIDRTEHQLKTDSGVEYSPHSMMHKAIVQMDPTKLEMLDRFEEKVNGYKYTPSDSNVRVIITGRDWSQKRLFVYGCTSSEEAEGYINEIVSSVCEIGHDAELIEGPKITNIAVSGDLGTPLQLEDLSVDNGDSVFEVEYEPEQFPAAIVRVKEISVTFMLYSTGKFVIQGLRRREDIEPAIRRIQLFLDNYANEV